MREARLSASMLKVKVDLSPFPWVPLLGTREIPGHRALHPLEGWRC